MTGVVILAAGASRRLGQPKQNVIYYGKTLLQLAVDAALASVCSPVIVVLGAHHQSIVPLIDDQKVYTLNVSNWDEGMSVSIRAGLAGLLSIAPELQQAVFMVCDQPLIHSGILNNLVEQQNIIGKPIAASFYNNTLGTPVLFSRKYFSELHQLTGDEGAKKLIKKYPDQYVAVPFPGGELDIDTAEDLQRIR